MRNIAPKNIPVEKGYKMREIKCSFKKTSDEDKAQFSKSSCLLTISVGQQTHEDNRFLATLDLVDKSFQRCVITLHDTLQRHTIALAHEAGTQADYHDEAYATGTLWLNRYQNEINKLTKNFTVIRWDEWLSHADFTSSKDKILSEITKDKNYASLFEQSIAEYLARVTRRLEDPSAFDELRAKQLCYDYLIEECAVLCLQPTTGCEFEIYAGTHNAAMNETRKRFVHNDRPNLIRSVSIGFNYRPDLAPQKFSLSNHR